MFPLKVAGANAFVLVLGLSLGESTQGADSAEPCDSWDVEYALAASLMLRETPMGEGDGTYAIGPGRTTLRYTTEGGRTSVKMLSYAMREQFTIRSKALVWTTTVTTNTKTGVIPEACGSAAEGALAAHVVRWSTPVSGYHTDGTLTCEGSLCGRFGAPPAGTMELHIAPHPVQFSELRLADDGKTFTMASTFVTKTEMPKQTGYLSLTGREVKRTCASGPVCK